MHLQLSKAYKKRPISNIQAYSAVKKSRNCSYKKRSEFPDVLHQRQEKNKKISGGLKWTKRKKDYLEKLLIRLTRKWKRNPRKNAVVEILMMNHAANNC